MPTCWIGSVGDRRSRPGGAMAAKRSARGGKVSLAARRSEARLRRRPEDPGARHYPWLILLGVVLLFQYGSLVAEGGWRAVTGYWSAQAAAIGWDDLASSGVGALLLSALLTAMGSRPSRLPGRGLVARARSWSGGFAQRCSWSSASSASPSSSAPTAAELRARTGSGHLSPAAAARCGRRSPGPGWCRALRRPWSSTAAWDAGGSRRRASSSRRRRRTAASAPR